MFDGALADDRLRNAADGHITCMRRDFHLQFQADIAIRMHMRSHIDIHADIQVGELRIHQWADARRGSSCQPKAGRKTARGDRYAVPNLQFGGLAVNRANFRVLDNLRVCVGQNGVRCKARQGSDVVVGIQVAELVQTDPAVARRWSAGTAA